MNKRPICENPKCTNGAIMNCFGKFLCGDCVYKIINRANIDILKRLED